MEPAGDACCDTTAMRAWHLGPGGSPATALGLTTAHADAAAAAKPRTGTTIALTNTALVTLCTAAGLLHVCNNNPHKQISKAVAAIPFWVQAEGGGGGGGGKVRFGWGGTAQPQEPINR